MAVILAVRTYAVWNKDKRVGIGLALLLVLLQVPNGIIAERFLNGIDCRCCFDPPLFFVLRSCLRVLKSPPSHSRPISGGLPGMRDPQCPKDLFRELGVVQLYGRRYVEHHLIVRPLARKC